MGRRERVEERFFLILWPGWFKSLRLSFASVTCSTALLVVTAGASQTPGATGWLDRPFASWNMPNASVPSAPLDGERRDQILKRCNLELRRSTPAERALSDAGWIPMLHLVRVLVRDDVEIIDGVVAADRVCEPAEFNAFVFVGGRFAGTLSPAPMKAQRDGFAGAIRIVASDEITVDFARYRDGDPECCPSSHTKVRFRINRTTTPPTIVPVEAHKTRE